MRTAPHLRGLPGGRRPDALVPGRGHVYLHTSMQPAAPKPELFDHEAHTERPTLPVAVRNGLNVLIKAVATPGSVPRPDQVRAALDVDNWCNPAPRQTDDAPAHGIPRPGAS